MKPIQIQNRFVLLNTLAGLIGCAALLCSGIDVRAQAGGGSAGGGGRGRASGSNNAVNTSVIAVADEHSNSLVIAAPEDLLPMIKQLVEQLDQPITDITELRVFHLVNADPNEMSDLFASLFPDETRNNSANTPQQQFRFGGPGGFGMFGPGFGGGGRGGTASTQSDRMKKQGKVLAIPDPRTSSLIVSAATTLMPQIAQMVTELDKSPAKKQRVYVYSLDNADPQQVAPILQEMFQRTTTSMNRNNANQNSPLTQRIQSNTQSMSTGTGSSGFGTGIGSGGAGAGGIGGGALR